MGSHLDELTGDENDSSAESLAWSRMKSPGVKRRGRIDIVLLSVFFFFFFFNGEYGSIARSFKPPQFPPPHWSLDSSLEGERNFAYHWHSH